MRDTLFSAIVMALISVLAFIAYKHPKGYARMYLPLVITAFCGFVLWFACFISYSTGFSDASFEYVKLNQTILKNPARESSPFWVWFLPLGVIVYLNVLKCLPLILDLLDDKKEEKPKDKVSEKGSDNDA